MSISTDEMDPAPQGLDLVVAHGFEEHVPPIIPPGQLTHLPGLDGAERWVETLWP